jgi:hypothetical protein
MMGSISGVSKMLIEKIPNIIIWHCLNHRLQFSLDDAIIGVSKENNSKYSWRKYILL